ncbi:MAG: 1,6-anhydro-N-acetylmuramyl-L-alanine amidase AmpD [Gallionellaceae bacterium]|nr:1,6-anhydro-N-acetylmuramyl-L-alanine amidase AmpD [Gallionellaceae bacterium]
MKINACGWLSGVRRVPSPNFDARPPNQKTNLLIIHSISLPPEQFSGGGVERLFTNTLNCDEHPYYERLRGVKVSAHFFIRRNGEITQFVSCNQRAWHAGVSEWWGKTRCNDFSLGIELEGSDSVSYTDAQYKKLQYLTRRLQRNYPLKQIVGHADIAPGRKTDPGPFFDWKRYLNSL